MGFTAANTPLLIPTPEFIKTGKGSIGGIQEVALPRAIKSNGEPDTGMYRTDDPPERQQRGGVVASVSIFDLSVAEDLKAYEDTLNLVGTSRFHAIRYTERHWDESIRNWKVFLEICESVNIAPDALDK